MYGSACTGFQVRVMVRIQTIICAGKGGDRAPPLRFNSALSLSACQWNSSGGGKKREMEEEGIFILQKEERVIQTPSIPLFLYSSIPLFD